jgi:hypothetical protein
MSPKIEYFYLFWEWLIKRRFQNNRVEIILKHQKSSKIRALFRLDKYERMEKWLYIAQKKGLIQLYQTYAFNMGCMTYFATILHPHPKNYTPTQKITPLNYGLV